VFDERIAVRGGDAEALRIRVAPLGVLLDDTPRGSTCALGRWLVTEPGATNLTGVELETTPAGAKRLAVPDSAVLDSGTRQIVLVRRGEGLFEPREVKLGARADGYVEVTDGVKAGEEVVVSANFLIDAESNLKAAIEGFGHAAHGAEPAPEAPAAPQPASAAQPAAPTPAPLAPPAPSSALTPASPAPMSATGFLGSPAPPPFCSAPRCCCSCCRAARRSRWAGARRWAAAAATSCRCWPRLRR
jgi:hypothetical protein